MLLKGRVAIVTGGTRDIGRQVSVKLASEGARVVVNYNGNEENAKQTLELINDLGGEAIICKADVTKREDVIKLVLTAVEHYGSQIDILVNVAGGLVGRKTLEEMDEDFWDYVMALNAKSCFLITKEVVPYMKIGGSIIYFSSQAGRDGGGPGASAYATSKGAIMTFTRAMAKELGPRKIRVNSVCPGMISTSFHDTFTKSEVREKVAMSTPIRREGKAEEVADLVTYLASNRSSFISGSNIDINGGMLFS